MSWPKSKWVWIATGAIVLVGLYALFGFYVAPRVLRSEAIEYVKDTYHRDLRVGDVRVQPFTLQLEVRDLALPDADNGALIGFRRLFVDLEASSLWHRALVLREVTLEAPSIRAIVRTDGRLNLADLATPSKPSTEPEKQEESGPPPLWVQAFSLTDGSVEFVNRLPRKPITRRLANVAFALRDFRTTPQGGGFALAARSPQDEEFEWKGRLALAPRVGSSGSFSIRRLQAPGVAEFLGDSLPFDLPTGLLELDGTYRLAVGDPTVLDVTLPRLAASGLALRARGTTEDWIEVPSLALRNTKLAWPAQTVAIDELVFDGAKARVWLDADRHINLERLFAAGTSESSAASAATEASTSTAGATTAAAPPEPNHGDRDWTLTLGRIALNGSSLDFEDRTVKPAARFVLAPLNVSVRDASLDLGRALPVEFDAKINEAATLKGTGEMVPDPFAAKLNLDVRGLALADLQPYANGMTDMTIRGGTVGGRGRLSLAPKGTKDPELRFAGDVTMNRFRSIDNALEKDFVNFERIEASRVDYAMSPDALRIDRVRILQPFARVIIGSNGIVNAAAVFDPEGTAAAIAAADAAKAAKDAEATRKKTRAEIRAEKEAAAKAAKARAKAPPAASPELKETGMPIRIREVAVTRGTMDFADFSVQPNFAAAVQSLDGRVTGLSSDPNSRATVKLTGNVGEFSPVHIDGTVQPFAYDRFTDLTLRFENISLPIFNPYSGRFAGYNIAKGKLTTDLHYQITARKLNATHKVRIDQLEWGEATAAKGEATLPVKFATSLLRDADGVITLDLPVSGTLDDPKFRIGPIIWQVIKNVLTKAVTLPFKALGALFKGAEDAQFVEFAPGQATLDATVNGHLAALGKSLVPKPDLKLEIPVGADPELDGRALAQARYEEARVAAMDTVLNGHRKKSDTSTDLPAFDTLEPDRQLEVLRALYQRLYGAAPSIPEPPAPDPNLSRKEARAQATKTSLEWLEAECRKRALAEPGDLDRLAQARAEAIQHALLTDTGLEPTRVFVVRNGKVTTTADTPRVRLELSVK